MGLTIQVYVRLGIRVLYKGWKTQIAGGRGTSLTHSPDPLDNT